MFYRPLKILVLFWPWWSCAFSPRHSSQLLQAGKVAFKASSLSQDPPQEQKERSIRNPLILVNEETHESIATGYELQPLPSEIDLPDQDELEMLYPTQRRYYQMTSSPNTIQTVRTTSFGCGKLGHQVWPCSIATSLLLLHEYSSQQDADGILVELGAGCGLPSMVGRDLLPFSKVIATDFWYTGQESERDLERLIPEVWHGINLQYNMLESGAAIDANKQVQVQQVDWHNLETVRQLGPVDVVVGSDIIYYPMDLKPLWNTLEALFQECGASKIIITSADKPEMREALPAFIEIAETKAANGDIVLKKEKFVLYKSQEALEARQDGERIILLTLTLP